MNEYLIHVKWIFPMLFAIIAIASANNIVPKIDILCSITEDETFPMCDRPCLSNITYSYMYMLNVNETEENCGNMSPYKHSFKNTYVDLNLSLSNGNITYFFLGEWDYTGTNGVTKWKTKCHYSHGGDCSTRMWMQLPVNNTNVPQLCSSGYLNCNNASTCSCISYPYEFVFNTMNNNTNCYQYYYNSSSSINSNLNTFEYGIGCTKLEPLSRSINVGSNNIVIPLIYYDIIQELTCKYYDEDGKYIISVSREENLNSSLIISTNGLIDQYDFSGKLFRYYLPDKFVKHGASLQIIVTTDNYNPQTCSIFIPVPDKCLDSNLSMMEKGFECMSSPFKLLYVIICMLIFLALLLLFVITVSLFTWILSKLAKCMSCCWSVKDSKAAKKVSGLYYLMLANLAGDTYAMNTYQVTEITLTSLLLYFVIMAFVVSVITMFIKCTCAMMKKRAKKAITEEEIEDMVNENRNREIKNLPGYRFKKTIGNPYLVVIFALMISVGISSCCTNKFVLGGLHPTCMKIDPLTQTCSIETDMSFELGIPGDCIYASDNDKSKPLSVKVSLINTLYSITSQTLYYTQDLTSYSFSSQICDVNNGNAESECNRCATTNDVGYCDIDATGFPPTNPSPYTETMCYFAAGPNHCLSIAKLFGYVYSEPTGSIYQVLKPIYYTPRVLLKVEITDDSPKSCNIWVGTSGYAECYGIIFRIGNMNSLNINVPDNFAFVYNVNTTEYAYDINVNPVPPTSCNLGAFQSKTIEGLSSEGILYDKYFTPNYRDDGVSYVMDWTACETNLNQIFENNKLPSNIGSIGSVIVDNIGLAFKPMSYPNVQIEMQISKNFNYTISSESVCPKLTDTAGDYIASGVFNSNTGFQFSIHASSDCFDGTATLSCSDITIVGDVLYLDTSVKQFVIQATSDHSKINSQCTLQGSNKKTFKITGELADATGIEPPTTKTIQGQKIDNWDDSFLNNDLNPESYMIMAILIVVAITCISVIVCGLIYFIIKCVL